MTLKLIITLLLMYTADCCTPFDSRVGDLSGVGGSSLPGSMSLGVASRPGQGQGASGGLSGLPGLSGMATPDQSRALGQNTHLGGLPGVTDGITSADELNCFDFDEKCRWKNVDGLALDQLDWFQGVGYLEENRMQVATGTRITPEGYYAIVATEKVHGPTGRAVLVSDPITCQHGPGQIKFMYWTSPKVQIKVCTKKTIHLSLEYDYCSAPIEVDDPGPTSVMIEDQGRDSFQIYIIAENFVWQAVGLQGGFAVLDNLEYTALMCDELNGRDRSSKFSNMIDEDEPPPMPPVPSFSKVTTNFPTLLDQSKLEPFDSRPDGMRKINISMVRQSALPNFMRSTDTSLSQMGRMEGLETQGFDEASDAVNREADEVYEDNTISDNNNLPTPGPLPMKGGKFVDIASACQVLSCNFTSGHCLQYVRLSGWEVSDKPVGNPLTGIKGDAKVLPYNQDGAFAYIAGPQQFARLTTPAFDLSEDVYFVFAYHKVDRNARLRVYAKRADQPHELLIYEAPEVKKDSKRWFREGKILHRALYQYIAFEVRSLSANHYLGIDELMILNAKRRPFCE